MKDRLVALSQNIREIAILGFSPFIPWAISIRLVQSTADDPLIHYFSYPIFLSLVVLIIHRLWSNAKEEWEEGWRNNPLTEADNPKEPIWSRIMMLSEEYLFPNSPEIETFDQPQEPILPNLMHWFWNMIISYITYVIMVVVSITIIKAGLYNDLVKLVRNYIENDVSSSISIQELVNTTNSILLNLLPNVGYDDGVLLFLIWAFPIMIMLSGNHSLLKATDEGMRRILFWMDSIDVFPFNLKIFNTVLVTAATIYVFYIIK